MNLTVPGYAVERPLGEGRTGEVFLALRESDAVQVALRRVSPALASKPGVRTALRALKAECGVLRAPTLVPILDVFEHQQDVFVVEQFVEGVALSDRLALGALPPEDVHALAMDLMDALSDLHRQGVVHGDVRPSNILMTSRGARLVGIGVAARTRRRDHAAGFLLRDPYDAPEMDQGVVSPLTDIYALGAVLMHAVTGDEGPYDFFADADAVVDELLEAISAAPESRPTTVDGLRLAFIDAEKTRGAVPAREQPLPSPKAPAEADVPAPAAQAESPRPAAPPRTTPLPPKPTKAVSARKDGTVAPGERFEELLDRARPMIPAAGAAVGLLVLAVLVLLLLPERPDGMILVEPAPGLLGDPAGQRDERPGFQASLSPFWLDRVEVTAAAYRTCVDAGLCTPPGLDWPAADRLPMTGVTWLQAQAYCVSRDKRLPTENEWETAARLPGRYPWGDAEPGCQLARYGVLPGGPCASADGGSGAAPVPDLDALEEGAFADLAGNVWELVDADHQPQRGPGSGEATVAGQSTLRVIKGGAWSAGPEHLRPAARIGVRIDYAAEDVGFRCGRSEE